MYEIIVDSFAGGGGASLGIEWALGKSPDVAINHDESAIVMHAANHPKTRHYTEDIWKLNPCTITNGRKVGLLWASPDCKHFSRAKGAKPVSKNIRSLAWVVAKWAAESKPRIIILENVREFEDWGPLVPVWKCGECEWTGTEGQAILMRTRRRCPRCESKDLNMTMDLVPDPSRKGLTFKRFVRRFKNLGYEVNWKVLNAADYGAPTHRRRLFLIARCDGKAIIWPEKTHDDPKNINIQELFSSARKSWHTAAECIDWNIECPSIFTRSKPLAEATMKRIALGIKRYVIDNPQPFIVTINHSGEAFMGLSMKDPMPTITSSRGEALVMPVITRIGQSGANGKQSNGADEPLRTVVSKAEHLLVSAFLAKHYGGAVGCKADAPLPTTTERGTQNQVCAAYLQPFYAYPGQEPDNPLPVNLSKEKHSIVTANLIHLNRGDKSSSSVDSPMRTATAGGNHAALVYSFLIKYFGTAIGQPVDKPLHTITGKDRFGLVIVNVNGHPQIIVDIGMRMLTPRELARGQGFPDNYILTGTKTSQVARIGNSVCPPIASVLVKSNYNIEEVTHGRESRHYSPTK